MNPDSTSMRMWTGVACLVADPGCEVFTRFGDDGKGAYVNIVAWADSGEDFVSRVKRTEAELDCILLELEGVRPLDLRMEEADFPEELFTMRATAERQPKDVVFGTFHRWTQSDTN